MESRGTTASGATGSFDTANKLPSVPSASESLPSLPRCHAATCWQRPHTIRLLKLIREGSTDYAEPAIVQLEATTVGQDTSASSSSGVYTPVQLWDLIGRLASICLAPSWPTRTMGALALQAMARHVPRVDQDHFLYGKSHDCNATPASPHAHGLVLRVADLLEGGGMDAVLQHGQALFALAESKYETRNDLNDWDDDAQLRTVTTDSESYVQERAQLQRAILARRLGLAALVKVIGRGGIGTDPTEQLLDETMRDDTDTSRPSKRPRQHSTPLLAVSEVDDAVALEPSDNAHSLRALLVLQCRPGHDTSGSAHQNPQTLLATELIYRMMDPQWHVRHGAALGILALLRAWHRDGSVSRATRDAAGTTERTSAPGFTLGTWPEDILARCLCVLALDRFGDFSGGALDVTASALSARADSASLSTSVVAPVREVVAQIVAVVWIMLLQIDESATATVSSDTLAVLHRLCYYESEWEVRHGALLALKYIVVTTTGGLDSVVPTRAIPLVNSTVISSIASIASELLLDTSDDVKSVAAQVLIEIGRRLIGKTADERSVLPDFLWTAIPPLWNQVHSVRPMSSCLVDLVALLAMFIQADANEVLRHIPIDSKCDKHDTAGHREHNVEQLDKIIRFLLRLFDADSPSVRVASLRSIGALCTSLGSIVPSLSSQNHESFVLLAEKTFELYFDSVSDPTQQPSVVVSRSLLDEIWKLVCDACVAIVASSTNDACRLLAELDCRWLCRFFEANGDQWMEAKDLAGQVSAAGALSYGLHRTSDSNCLGSVTQTALVAFFDSPCTWQVEASCLLYRALKSRMDGKSLGTFEMLLDPEAALPCLDEKGTSEEETLAYNKAVVSVLNDVASGTVASFDTDRLRVKLSSLTAASSTKQSVAPVAAMRVRTSLAGAVIARGLPSKVTPLVRSLMTSFNNEPVSSTYTIELGVYLQQLLQAMSQDTKYDKGFNKVVDTLCDTAVSVTAIQHSKACYHRQHIAISVLQSLMQSQYTGRRIADVPPLQRRLCHLSITEMITSDFLLESSCTLLGVLTGGLDRDSSQAYSIVNEYAPTLVELSCSVERGDGVRRRASSCLEGLCTVHASHLLRVAVPLLTQKMRHSAHANSKAAACIVLDALIQVTGTAISGYVRSLLPLVLSLVTSSIPTCAQHANSMFAALVRVAPLVGKIDQSLILPSADTRSDSVIDHLIHGKPLPVREFPKGIALEQIKLRNYQKEGIAWLEFLRSTNLSGALCDDMGLGKSLQALVAVALAHHYSASAGERPVSLVICPSSLVGHWKEEIDKHFRASSEFCVLCLVGSRSERQSLWSSRSSQVNLVITSYGVLRCDVDYLESVDWSYCILDEGHLLKNPKTATAQACRRLKARSKLVLTGTPIQNNIFELWATFDFLMPNFLGTSTMFTKDFANPITKSQLPGASASSIAAGIAKLKLLHQQVLPFILRREKDQVLPELPATTLSVVRVQMSGIQQSIYNRFRAQEEGSRCLDILGNVIEEPSRLQTSVNADVLKSLLFLRLVCTHPSLVLSNSQRESSSESLFTIGASGKLLALSHLLKEAGIYNDDLTGADNDTSLLYYDEDSVDEDAVSGLLESPEEYSGNLLSSSRTPPTVCRKCLIFAQFSRSLDAVEEFLFRAHMPSLQYVRIDGTVPQDKRTSLIARFATDPNVRVMLLTTRVGGLGLNLTAASMVIFLESDLNPFADIQAQDRCRRIGQTQQVDVYRLVTKDSIEESILVLQDKKKRVADSVVNTENSTMYSMGTDRLLDVFSLPGAHEKDSCDSTSLQFDLDGFVERCSEDYKSLSVTQFTESFERHEASKSVA